VGFLDRAKQLAEQAKGKAEEALSEVRSRASATSAASSPATSSVDQDPRLGTPYVPGMLGRPGWREQGLADPAAVLPVDDRDRAGIPHGTRSEIVEEPFGMGRRWSSGGASVGLYYQLYPEHRGWTPPGGTTPYSLRGASIATLPDGRSLVFLGSGDRRAVLEASGLEGEAEAALARAVADHLE
jgi:hypothetical protein